jgi:hypothetical protein
VTRAFTIFYIAIASAGCATAPQPGPEAPIEAAYIEAPSAALVFDLPADRGIPHPELARAGRGPATFMGFDTATTESYITATDNISTDLGDFYTQESVVVKSATRLR